MSNIEDTLWDHLVEHHGVDRVAVRSPERPRTRRRPVMIGTAATGLAAVAAAATLIVSATTSTPPAYALTPHANGSYTLTINNIATAVPRVNAEFAKLGINANAVPVTASCTAQNTTGIPLANLGMSMSQSVTIDNANIPAGTTALVAAEQTPSGSVRLSMGTTAAPLPACLNTNQAQPRVIIPNSKSK